MFRLVLAVSLVLSIALRTEAKPYGFAYRPGYWNTTCRYYALNVPAFDFFAGQDLGLDASLFPMENNEITAKYKYALQACFGPAEKYDDKLVAKGKKLPCKYVYNKKYNIDYWEEQACPPTLLSNCYCYGLNRYKAGFCIPGGPANQARDTWTCNILKAAIKRDGGREVTYETVMSRLPRGTHYIAAGVAANSSAKGANDFHIWRYDANRIWSWKSGFTFVRNTYKSGAPVLDIRDKKVRKLFPQFCGFFDVNYHTHKLHALSLSNAERQSNSDIPGRFQGWKATKKFRTKVVQNKKWSKGWYQLYKSAFVDLSYGDVGVKVSDGARRYYPNASAGRSTIVKTSKRTRKVSTRPRSG